jgi:hypothetical protein
MYEIRNGRHIGVRILSGLPNENVQSNVLMERAKKFWQEKNKHIRQIVELEEEIKLLRQK